jgi:heme-degrading monooxygenase HmoA
MYMRVTRSRVDVSRLDEALGQLAADLRAAISGLPGYQSYTLAVDRASGQALSISTWDTDEHARWSRGALGDILPRLQALGMQIDGPEFFEVTSS